MKIRVTKNHLNKSIKLVEATLCEELGDKNKGYCSNCILATALTEKFPLSRVHVNYDIASVNRKNFTISDNGKELMRTFDSIGIGAMRKASKKVLTKKSLKIEAVRALLPLTVTFTTSPKLEM